MTYLAPELNHVRAVRFLLLYLSLSGHVPRALDRQTWLIQYRAT